MTDPDAEIAVNTAIARLQDFIDTYPEGEQINGDMPLTVDDVRLVIEAAKVGAQTVTIQQVDLQDLAKRRD